MIVLDASVLIAHFNADDVHHHRATDLLSDHAAGGLAASVITVAEVLAGPARTGGLTVARANRTMHRLRVRSVPLDDDAAAQLAMLRCTGLKMPDCCVLWTYYRLPEAVGVATFDARIATVAVNQNIPVIE